LAARNRAITSFLSTFDSPCSFIADVRDELTEGTHLFSTGREKRIR